MSEWMPIRKFNPEVHKGRLLAECGGFHAIVEWHPPHEMKWEGWVEQVEGRFLQCGEYEFFPEFFMPVEALPQPPKETE